MATLNPQILLAQQPIKPPNLDFSQTFVDMAKLRAYSQAQRLEELKYGQVERAYARDEEFNRLAAGLFMQPQAPPQASPPAAAPSQRGLAGGPPGAVGGPPPTGPSMAGQVPPPLPGENYAMAPGMAQGPPGPGGMPQSFTRAPSSMQSLATAPAPLGGGQGSGMPPGIPPSPSMEPGTFMSPSMREAPPGALPGAEVPRGLAAPMSPSGVPSPAVTNTAPRDAGEPPQGLGAAQPGAPKSLLQPINEQVLMQLYAANPEKASKLMEGHLKMQEQKLTTSEKMNDQIYQTLSAVERSSDPARFYPEAIKSLRKMGIPIPDSFPAQYDPALVRFKIMEHETLKNQLEKATILHEEQKAKTARADELYKGAQARREGTQSELDVATTGLRKAEAGRVPAQQAEDEARAAQLRQQTSDLVNERKIKAGQVTPYTTDADWNVYLSQAMKEAGLPPGASPNDHPEVIAKARQAQVDDKQQVVRKTGLDAAAKVLPEVDQKRLLAASDKGAAGEGLDNTLDEVERLISEGVYTNIPEHRLNQILSDAGLRASDPIAARTARLHELGHSLAIEQAGGKLGGQVSDTDLKAIQAAGGNFQSLKGALQMQESVKGLRHIARTNKRDANYTLDTYKNTKEVPRFGAAREERLKILTPERLEEAYQAKKAQGWTKPQVRQGLIGAGWKEE